MSAVLSLGPAGYAALGPGAPRADNHQAAGATARIPRGLRDVDVLTRIAREGDREADLVRAGTAPSASPTPSSPPTALDPVPDSVTTSAAPAPRPRPSHTPSGAPPRRPKRSPRPAPTGTTAGRDTTTPNTRLVARFPTRNGAAFLVSADEPASFAYSLDGAAYAPCSSAASFTNLEAGWHTFAVRAIDIAGNADPTPSQVRWHASGGH